MVRDVPYERKKPLDLLAPTIANARCKPQLRISIRSRHASARLPCMIKVCSLGHIAFQKDVAIDSPFFLSMLSPFRVALCHEHEARQFS